MPYWCKSMYAFITNDLNNKSELKRLYDSLSKVCNTYYFEENYYRDNWLKNVAIDHNILSDSIKCEGKINWMSDFNNDINYFIISTYTIDKPLSEFWDCVLKQYKGISYIYTAEVDETELYINTDINGDIFPIRFMFYESDLEPQHFKDEIKFIEFVNDYLGENFNNFEEVKDYVTNLRKSEPDIFIGVHKYEFSEKQK